MTNKGFTLIELLVTIMLVAVLATYSIFAYMDSIYEAENKQAKSKLELMAGAIERFVMEYPDLEEYNTALKRNVLLLDRGTFDNTANSVACRSNDTSHKRLVACNYIPRIDYSAQKYSYHLNGKNGADCSSSVVYMTAKPGAKTGKYKGSYCAGINSKGESFDQF